MFAIMKGNLRARAVLISQMSAISGHDFDLLNERSFDAVTGAVSIKRTAEFSSGSVDLLASLSSTTLLYTPVKNDPKNDRGHHSLRSAG